MRSVGYLTEILAEHVEEAALEQEPVLRKVLLQFATEALRIEYLRKSLYERIRPYSQTILLNSANNSYRVQNAISKRTKAMGKVKTIHPVDHVSIAENNNTRMFSRDASLAAASEIRNWMEPHGRELKEWLRNYALAQLEYSAKALEHWSKFTEMIATTDFSKGTEDLMATMSKMEPPALKPPQTRNAKQWS